MTLSDLEWPFHSCALFLRQLSFLLLLPATVVQQMLFSQSQLAYFIGIKSRAHVNKLVLQLHHARAVTAMYCSKSN